ncbi:metallophosphoesterase [Fodinisporobacter ferrooxydans]|uniref:Metallophosphoesterase n=1 Tax=Fodinisporobacter ferrooxydans TaxID=2901836 RepID=A0ABY4CKR6_9BACL|nr:metallophosphoesterase [Alicyclobacillaceae bacterium MYW30-H2]
MSIYAIGDLHLSFAADKPMDVFGKQWSNHPERIAKAWKQQIKEHDIVLLPGDISWAMNYEEAAPDLQFIADLPGHKIMIKGNHDYWWSTIKKVREHLPASIFAIQNDAIAVGDYVVAGTRGWNTPSMKGFTLEDHKLYSRELGRLRLSLEQAKQAKLPILCMLHYPPTDETFARTEVIDLLEEFEVIYCVYGHLHGEAVFHAMPKNLYKVPCELVSADAISFAPKCILK